MVRVTTAVLLWAFPATTAYLTTAVFPFLSPTPCYHTADFTNTVAVKFLPLRSGFRLLPFCSPFAGFWLDNCTAFARDARGGLSLVTLRYNYLNVLLVRCCATPRCARPTHDMLLVDVPHLPVGVCRYIPSTTHHTLPTTFVGFIQFQFYHSSIPSNPSWDGTFVLTPPWTPVVPGMFIRRLLRY